MYRIKNVKNGEYLEFKSYDALINELSRYNFINYITKHLEKNWKRNNKCRKQWECAVKRRSKHMYTDDTRRFHRYTIDEIGENDENLEYSI